MRIFGPSALAVLIVVPGCDPVPVSPDAAPPNLEMVDLPLGGPVPLDVLLVIDNSGSMLPYQAQLAGAFHRLTDELAAGGVLPDLHLGVVTSDLGTLTTSTGDASCSSSDGGLLQTSGCAGITDARFLTDAPDPATGGRVTNYTGTLDAAVQCMVRVGNQGCGFEQHLEAMKIALDSPGFLRPEADLGILVLGDEDDCSAYDPAFFGIESPTLGPLDSFRCFEFGVVCNPDDPRSLGPKSGCVPRDDSPYLHAMSRYVDFVRGKKPDPTRISVGLITGPTSPVEVTTRTPMGGTPRPDLAPSCSADLTSGTVTADPAIRLTAFASAFEHHVVAAACAADYPALSDLGELAHRTAVGDPCFAGTVLDGDGDAGIQAECDVTLVVPAQPDTALPACDGTSANAPCWRIEVSAACTAGAHHALTVVTTGDPVSGTRVHASCVVQ